MSTIKILCFAILGMVAGNAEYALTAAPVLDFDTIAVHNANIPSSFQPKWSANIPAGINVPNGRYIYFTVVPNGGGAAGNVNFAPLNIHGAAPAAPRAPVAGDINIYFPADGSQPTTPEAVEYSCANIDNRESSPITEWYMKMFGVIPFQNTGNPANDYIKAGWKSFDVRNNRGNDLTVQLRTQIISFAATVDGTMVNDPNIPGAQISRRALFEREFRKIASTSVGRVLLYRILIEIRRHTLNNVGRSETGIDNTEDELRHRNRYRCLNIAWGHFGLSTNKNELTFHDIFTTSTVVGNSHTRISPCFCADNGYTKIVRERKTQHDINIFHEFVHWFHKLRDIGRYNEECNTEGLYPNVLTHPIGEYYWNNLDGKSSTARIDYSYFNWRNDQGYPSFEDIRTILGSYRSNVQYVNGDDLSENLYRMNTGRLIRFGHQNLMFYEDRKVVNRVINSCITSYVDYNHCDDIDFNFNDSNNILGMGNLRIYI